MLLWIEINHNRNKESARAILTKAESTKVLEFINAPFFISYRVFIEIWNGNYERALEYLPKYLNNSKGDDDQRALSQILLLLLAKKQYNTLLKVFDEYHYLKEQYKPIYYALMYNLKTDFPNEYLKMGEELKQPIEDILAKVQEMETNYK